MANRTDAPGSAGSIPISTRAVHGIVVDPFFPVHVASYADDGLIRIWDIRKLIPEPLLSFDAGINLAGIQYSESKPGLLASYSKDSSSITFWSVKYTSTAPQERETSLMATVDLANLNLENGNTPAADIDCILYDSRTIMDSGSIISDFCWIPNLKKDVDPLLLTCSPKEPKLALHRFPTFRYLFFNLDRLLSLL
jgi:WD40 repeat protein